ncbi:transposase [Streptomyces sp. NPDC002619]|uniref:transposase n=1 Tax=Streptomyces sp. NPDC002619 TaxID=3364655 RepID=UPI0036A5DB18
MHRFATAAAFAAYCGTAPREVSSGDRSRHRLSRAGDRRLNYAIQVTAVTQRRIHPPAQAYANASAWRARAGKEHAMPQMPPDCSHLPPAHPRLPKHGGCPSRLTQRGAC